MVRTQKRVRALRRAPDGSGFQNCDECGVSVPVALMDMHNCKAKRDLKRLKRKTNNIFCKEKLVYEEPRSPFLFFMESYAETCKAHDLVEINREAFEKWKNMSTKEQWPFILHAQKVENVYLKLLHQEMNEMSQEEDDEADSALVGKVALQFEDYENSDSSECCDTCDWPLTCPWHR
ncbi:high mobility group B protein 7 [Silene latifolia]|uniref:high mobility group B protein 7 n=1 Tax=Silene latifolia TaxID=37657 RepID=UPI003D780CD2